MSCNYNSFQVPSPPDVEILKSNISISQLKTLVSEGGYISENYVVEGVITSSDSSSNFYNQLYLEDSSGSLELLIKSYDIYLEYGRWRKATLLLRGLSTLLDNHTLKVGYASSSSTRLDALGSMSLIREHLFVNDSPITLSSSITSINKLTPNQAGNYISLRGRFKANELYFFNGEREFCDNTGIINVYTSSYADFSNAPLPQGEIVLRGILSYKGKRAKLQIVTLDDIN